MSFNTDSFNEAARAMERLERAKVGVGDLTVDVRDLTVNLDWMRIGEAVRGVDMWSEAVRDVDWEKFRPATDLLGKLAMVSSVRTAPGNYSTSLTRAIAGIDSSPVLQASNWLADLDFKQSPIIQAVNSLANLELKQYPVFQALDSLVDYTRRMTSPVDLSYWQSDFMRSFELPEVLFAPRLPEIDRLSVYRAARSGIFDVAEELREMYDFSKLKVVATWLDSPLVTESFTLDLDDDFDFPDEPVTTIPLRAPRRYRRRRKPPEFVAPLEEIDTTVGDNRPLIPVKRVIKEMSNTQFTVLILGSCASAGAVSSGIAGAITSTLMGTVTLVVAARNKPED